jgi:hypothetical protein
MSNHVFVSHSHEDAPAAELLVKALEEREVVCWLAPRDVPAGGSYAESILNAIESASCFVLIYSQNSNVSSHVMREVERALKFGVNIVPVRFDDSTPSKSLDYLLATVHWLAITPDARDRSIVKAAEQILAAVAKSQSARPAAEPDRAPPSQTVVTPVTTPPKRPLLWIGVVVALVLVAGLIGFFVLRNPSHSQSAGAGSMTAAPSADQASALALLHRYFDLLDKRDATAAFNLLSPNFRSHLSFAIYSRNVGLAPTKLVEATIVSKSERNVSVTAVFEDANPASQQPQWRAPIELVLEPDGWKIDGMKGLAASNGRPLRRSVNGPNKETTPDVGQSMPQSTPASSAIPASSPVHPAMYGIVQDPQGTTAVREGPFVQAKIVAMVKNGDRLEIDQMQRDWAHVIIGPDKSGFIHKSWLKITPETP